MTREGTPTSLSLAVAEEPKTAGDTEMPVTTSLQVAHQAWRLPPPLALGLTQHGLFDP